MEAQEQEAWRRWRALRKEMSGVHELDVVIVRIMVRTKMERGEGKEVARRKM